MPSTQPAYVGTLGIGVLGSSGWSLASLEGDAYCSLCAQAGPACVEFGTQPLAYDPASLRFNLGGSAFIEF